MITPYKACPRCQTAAALHSQRCDYCGHLYRTQFAPPDPTQMYYGAPAAPRWDQQDQATVAQSKQGMIAAMWTLTAISFVGGIVYGNGPVPIMVDAVACILAVILVCSANRADKWNGSVKLSIEAVFFVIGFMNGFSRAIHPY